MKLVKHVFWICMIVATVSLSLSYTLISEWWLALCCLILGGLWGWDFRTAARDWTASISLAACLGLAVSGLLLEAGVAWICLSVIAALSAWDLHNFSLRLRWASQEASMKLVPHHLRRLALSNGLGLLLAIMALTIRTNIGFGVILFLTAIAIVFVGRFINIFRRTSD